MKVAALAENVTVTGASPTVDTTSANVSRQPERAADSGHARRPRHLGARRSQSAGSCDQPARRRRHVRRPAGRLQRARHHQRAEHVVPERRQRRRPGGDRRRGLLLRLRRVRRHPGVDRCARHHRADLRRLPEHDHEDRRQQMERQQRRSPGPATRLQGRNDTDPTLQKYGFRPNGNTSDFVSDINITGGGPLIQNKLRFFGVVPRLARAHERARCRIRRWCSTRPTSPRVWATSRGRPTRTTGSPGSTRASATASRTGC